MIDNEKQLNIISKKTDEIELKLSKETNESVKKKLQGELDFLNGKKESLINSKKDQTEITKEPKIDVSETNDIHDVRSVFSIKTELKILKKRSEIFLNNQNKKRILDNSAKLNSDIDSAVYSIALNRFAVRKKQKLDELKATKEQLDEFIANLSKTTVDDSTSSKMDYSLKSFLLDKKYIKSDGKPMDANEILDSIGYKKIDSDKSDKDKTQNKSLDNYADEIFNKEKSNNIAEVITSKEDEVKDDLNIKVNDDIATVDTFKKTNKKIIDFLIKEGEVSAAEYLNKQLKLDNISEETNDLSSAVALLDKRIKKIELIDKNILGVLDKIEENSIDEQPTEIEDVPSIRNVLDNMPSVQNIDVESLQQNIQNDQTNNNKPSKISNFLTNIAKKTAIPLLATAASGLYISSELGDSQKKYDLSTTEHERTEAKTERGVGLAGATVGAFAGGKALGSIGSIIGSFALPLVGTAFGAASGVVTGAAAGAAAGYYMGDAVGKYIADMWSGPLDKVPDDKRDNPFTLHEYLTNVLIPEFQTNLNAAENMSEEERKQSNINIDDLKDGIEDYTEISKEILTPENITEWMETKLEDNNLEDVSSQSKQEYLKTIMSQFEKNKDYYNLGMGVIPEITKESFLEKLFKPDLSKTIENKKIKTAKKMVNFNNNNKLGKNGRNINLSIDNTDKNIDALINENLLEDGLFSNSINFDEFEKYKKIPTPVLKDLITNGDLDEESSKALSKIYSERIAKLNAPVLKTVNNNYLDNITKMEKNTWVVSDVPVIEGKIVNDELVTTNEVLKNNKDNSRILSKENVEKPQVKVSENFTENMIKNKGNPTSEQIIINNQQPSQNINTSNKEETRASEMFDF